MARWISLPKLGTNMESAVVLAWLKREGDAVAQGTPLVEVETDKASFVVEAEVAGTLAAVQVAEGETAFVREPLAAILEPGETDADAPPVPPAGPGRDHLQRVRSGWRASAARPERGEAAAMAPAARTLARNAGLAPDALAWAANGKVLTTSDVAELLEAPRAVIYGAGLGGKQVLEVLRSSRRFLPIAFVDDDDSLHGTCLGGLPVLSEREGVTERRPDAVLLSFHSEVRRRIYLRLAGEGVPMPPLVDARAMVGSGLKAMLGDGVLVEAGAVLGPDVTVGDGAIVDIGAVIAHDCAIGAHCHVSPGASVSGAVDLGDNVLIGVGASVNSTVRIGSGTIVAPGSAVMNDLPADVIAAGVPARVIGESKRNA
ncbi:MAG TPA: biotin/lipoyl-containing protein [Thermoleophilaceae bacterium]